MPESKPLPSLRALLSGIIDYAGLFPPASLSLAKAVGNYTSARAGINQWALGRFVVPAAQVAEARKAYNSTPFSVTVLVDQNAEADLAVVREGAKAGLIDSVEMKAATPAQIRSAAEVIPSGVVKYFEIPLAQDPRKCIETIAEVGARAKARTGGQNADAFPGSRDLARFLVGCVASNVAFKATSGLHHPLRGTHAPAPGAEPVLMHGFLNVFLAASFLRAGLEATQVVRLLEDTSPKAFQFDEEGVNWRDERLEIDQILDARTNVGIAFGCCEFDEPMADLAALGLV